MKTEHREISLVRNLIEPGDIVLDVGAHKAAFSYWMSKAAGRSGRVIAFEPIPHLAEYIRRVATIIKGARIDVIEKALSNETGQAKLFLAGPNLGCATLEHQNPQCDSITVATMTLDSCLKNLRIDGPISFIKCDVESHELNVFHGGQNTLRRDKPVLLFESGNLRAGRASFEPVFQFLQSLGYRGYFFADWELIPVENYDSSIHDIDPAAYQNFVFTHPDTVFWQSRIRPYAIQRMHQPRNQRQAA